ncbi:MAG: NUDIX domain-containing protein [Alphaproteobacteria bacterium]|nr:NUDIX domain-containing protein [Alphaproteobacteria bacterium]
MEKYFKHSIKAIIIKDGKLLTVSVDYGRGRYNKLPGGGHEWGETIQQALIRECKEELNLDITPKRLVLARDYIAKNHKQPYDLDCFHLSELMFECDVDDFSALGNGSEPDSDVQKIQWIDLNKLADSDFYPKAIIPYLQNLDNIKETVVLGDVN